MGYFKGIQSSEMCSICIMADARDKSQMYAEVFSEFYKYTDQLQMQGMTESDYGPALHPMVVSYSSDLEAIWTTSGRGGNCKKTNFFCHLCTATRHELVKWKGGGECFNRCIAVNRTRCYHHLVCDSATVGALLEDLEEFLLEYIDAHRKHYNYVLMHSKLNYDPSMAL
jgi:hypothetical protein